MMVIMALVSVTLVGAMALGTDVAVLYYNWMQLQKAADAAALAGADYLPKYGADAAAKNATTYLADNGVASPDTFSATPQAGNTQMLVTASRTVPYYFARVLGLTSGTVSVTALATIPPGICTVNASPTSPISCGGSDCLAADGKTNLTAGCCEPTGTAQCASGSPFPPSGTGCGSSTGAYNVLPIAADSQTAGAYVRGQSYVLNRADGSGKNSNGPWVDAPGNWGFVQLCGNNNGNGGSGLRSAIAGGYYGELTIGNTLSTLPGVKNGPVSQGLQGLLDRAPGTSSVPTPSTFDPTDPRAVIIPMASYAGCSGQCTIPITGFLAFYINLVDTTSTNSNGVNGVIHGTFVGIVDTTAVPSINAPNAGAVSEALLIK
jgi:Flp pilus assembly protein TadG